MNVPHHPQNIPPQLIIAAILVAILSLLLSGCAVVVNWAPEARTFSASLYTHNQNASNMVVNQTIPVEFLKAQDFGKAAASAHLFSGNTAKGISK